MIRFVVVDCIYAYGAIGWYLLCWCWLVFADACFAFGITFHIQWYACNLLKLVSWRASLTRATAAAKGLLSLSGLLWFHPIAFRFIRYVILASWCFAYWTPNTYIQAMMIIIVVYKFYDCDLATPVSWRGNLTRVVVAAMAGVRFCCYICRP